MYDLKLVRQVYELVMDEYGRPDYLHIHITIVHTQLIAASSYIIYVRCILNTWYSSVYLNI